VTVELFLNGLERWPRLARLEPRLRRAAGAALGTVSPPPRGELSISFVPDEQIARLNREWLGREGATDVIAFSLGDDGLLGDVYIAPDTAGRNARALGVDPDEEALRLVIHGTLHVLGHDHPEGDDRYGAPMFELQEELLRGLAGD
jgi:probable rRNA maturation factor